jgi:predicted lipoprotein with Yx(FWY)xxD motif
VSKKIFALAVVALAALVIAGCGGGDSSSSESGGGGYGGGGGETTGASSKSEGGSGGAAVVSLGTVPQLGMVLVDSNGMTLYDFHKDKGTTSSCYGACAQAWPPLTTAGEPQVGNGASASKLGTTERNDGTTQVTYAGHPLYLFVEDQKPGEANGNDVSAFGAEWYALTASGAEPED